MSKTKELFCTFFKIGAFTFGGGYAMVALLQNEFVEEKKWVTKEELSEVITNQAVLKDIEKAGLTNQFTLDDFGKVDLFIEPMD